MEAKDYYTGGHTERVSEVAVALAERLGYSGAELDAIEIGALLHDIGKIGIPERILHKPGPLDDDEWKVMKEHPLISEYILSGGRPRPDRAPGGALQPRADRRQGLSRRARRRPDPAARTDRARRRRLRRADQRPSLPRRRTVAAAMEEVARTRRHAVLPARVEALETLYREQPQLLGAADLRAVGDDGRRAPRPDG